MPRESVVGDGSGANLGEHDVRMHVVSEDSI
jgi:hypothetical protein